MKYYLNYDIDYNICAIFVLVVILISLYIKERINDERNHYMNMMIWTMLGSIIFDFILMMDNVNYEYYIYFRYISVYGYYILHGLATYYYAAYNKSLSQESGQRDKKILIKIPYLCFVTCLVINLFTNKFFEVSKQGIYRRKEYIVFLYLFSLFYVFYGAGRVVKGRKVISRQKRIASYVFLICGLVGCGTQFLYPKIMVESFSVALGYIIMCSAIQNPEELLDSETDCFNRIALIESISYIKDKKFSMIIVKIDDFSILNRNYSIINRQKVLKQVGIFLKNLNKDIKVFHVYESVFVIKYEKKSINNAHFDAVKINNRFNRGWKVSDNNIKLSSHVCTLDYPSNFENQAILFEYIKYMDQDSSKHSEKIIDFKKMDINNKNRVNIIRGIINDAIDNDGFYIKYQPIHNKKGEMEACEALVRLKDEETLGYISPEEFIPISEQDGTIVKIGEIVVDKVCKFIKGDTFKNSNIKYVEVNLSVIQCMQIDLADKIKSIVDGHNISHKKIIFEITESVAITFSEIIMNNINKLSEIGFEFSLDDFGMGYSNMVYLLNFKYKIVKIDKTFLWTAQKDEKGRIAFNNTIEMLKKMDLQVVVEGIETQQQLEGIKHIPCDYIQGNYFSEPISEKELKQYSI